MNTTQNPTYQVTPSDKLFYQLMGFYPAKAGASFELIATSVTNIIQKESKAIHDLKIKGFTTATHQIDGVVGNVAVEAKDHAAGDKEHAVGIGEMRNFEGALCDIIEFESGKFWTSTSFTKDAQQYAHGLSPINHQKVISLFKSRPSTEADREGRIETIQVNINICRNEDEYQLGMQDAAAAYVNSLPQKGYYPVLYDQFGNKTRTFTEAIDKKYGAFDDINDGKVKSENEYVKINNETLVPIDGFIFNRKIVTETETLIIKGEGEPVLLVMCEEENLNKLFTDVELKREIIQLLSKK